MLISTGMATLVEIEEAVAAVRMVNPEAQLALLKCSAAYPAGPDDLNLATIGDLRTRFNVPIGFSDHTLGTAAAVAAVVLGATIIEKHVCLSRAEGGPDAHFSCEPAELGQLVDDVRTAWVASGEVVYGPSDEELATLPYRRSLFVVEDVAAGERFTSRNVRSIRPATGLPPKYLDDVLGEAAARDLRSGTPLTWDAVIDGES
jgi:N-acetylneuraminate synthase